MPLNIQHSKFNINQTRRLFVIGERGFKDIISDIVSPFSFISVTDFKDFTKQYSCYLLIAEADFDNIATLQTIARIFTDADDHLAHKIVFAIAPMFPWREQFLFAAELGAKYVVYGKNKENDLRNYLKRVTVEAESTGSLGHYQNEIERFWRANDKDGLYKLSEKIFGINKDSEEVLRLMVAINQKLNRHDKVERYLKRILTINPQNLWAANTLGKLYLKMHKAGEGIEILEKLSQFHELNGERFLTMGQAYLNCGMTDKAEQVLKKGDDLSQSQDKRFNQELAKVEFLRGKVKAALEQLKDRQMNIEVLSFLNTRAIMEIKRQKFDYGMELYNIAKDGCSRNEIIKSKILFNMGLGYVRANAPEKALTCFQESSKLGGDAFSRAQRPLEITQKIITKQNQNQKTSQEHDIELDGFDYEKIA